MSCVNCKEKEKLQYFSIRDNGLKCEACSKQDKSALYMSESTLNAIKYTVTAPAKKLFSFNLKNEALEEIKLITKIYFNEKLEKVGIHGLGYSYNGLRSMTNSSHPIETP